MIGIDKQVQSSKHPTLFEKESFEKATSVKRNPS